MKTRGASLLCSFAWALSACGSAASYDYELPDDPTDYEPTLAQMSGKTAGEAPDADPKRLRIALVWFPVSPAAGKVQHIQNVKHHQFGWGYFQVGISREPPPRAIEGADMMRYAQAEVILYEDRNDNKWFDLVNVNSPSVDRVIGRATGVRVWWLGDGLPAPEYLRGLKPVQEGWSVTYGPIMDAPDVRDCDPGREMGDTWKPLCSRRVREPARDASAQGNGFTMQLSNDPRLQSYACLGFWGTSSEKSDEWPDTTPGWNSPAVRKKICNPATCDSQGEGAELDLPVAGRDVVITCNDDETTYAWKDCEPDPALCGTVFCHEGRATRKREQPKPANWPSCR